MILDELQTSITADDIDGDVDGTEEVELEEDDEEEEEEVGTPTEAKWLEGGDEDEEA